MFQSLDVDPLDAGSLDAGSTESVPVDTGLEYGPQPARRAARPMPVSYGESDPTDTEQTAPVVSISDAPQPVSALRRLIGGRRG